MWGQSLDSASIIKLKQLVASRFGKGVEIRQLLDISEQYFIEDGFQLKGYDLHIPIAVEGAVLGKAVVPEASDLDQDKQKALAQLIRMVLEPTLYSWYLERKEENLETIKKNETPIHSFSQIDQLDDSDIDLEETDDLEDLSEEKPQLISNLIHLDGKNEQLIKKTALQIHEMTHRWAFVPFKDVRSQINSLLDLCKLGAVTLLIEEVLDLTTSDQELLLEYLESPRSDEEPLIISTSKTQLGEVILTEQLSHRLIDELSVNCFEVDRAPLGYHNLRQVLELFFLKDKGLPT